jgi:hypothetical protein
MNVVVFKDSNTEMMGIEVNQKTVFYGNYWDFSVPNDLEKLLLEIQKVNPDIKVTVCKACMEDEQ